LLENKVFDNNLLLCSTYDLNIKVINKKILKNNLEIYKNLIEKYNIIENIESMIKNI